MKVCLSSEKRVPPNVATMRSKFSRTGALTAKEKIHSRLGRKIDDDDGEDVDGD